MYLSHFMNRCCFTDSLLHSFRFDSESPTNFSKGGGVPPKGSRKMPSPFLKPCIRCGTLSVNNLCNVHMAQMKAKDNARGNARKARTNQYGGAYKRLAKIIRENAETCHICGQGWRPNDPFEADHLTPGSEVYSLSQLAPAHRSCNIARGNKS